MWVKPGNVVPTSRSRNDGTNGGHSGQTLYGWWPVAYTQSCASSWHLKCMLKVWELGRFTPLLADWGARRTMKGFFNATADSGLVLLLFIGSHSVVDSTTKTSALQDRLAWPKIRFHVSIANILLSTFTPNHVVTVSMYENADSTPRLNAPSLQNQAIDRCHHPA